MLGLPMQARVIASGSVRPQARRCKIDSCITGIMCYTCDMPIMMAAPLVKPVMTLWLRKRTIKPSLSTPMAVYMQATRNASCTT